jgi:hypothetical protein
VNALPVQGWTLCVVYGRPKLRLVGTSPDVESIVTKVDHLMKLCDELEAKLRRSEDRASKLVEAVVQEMVG